VDYTYQFEAHLREHRPSRLGQRLWWIPAAVGVGVVIAEGVYLAGAPLGQLSAPLAVALPFIAAALFLVAWAALSIADWTYASEKHYREAHNAAASQALAYILAGRRTRGEPDLPIAPSSVTRTPSHETASRHRGSEKLVGKVGAGASWT
jgi:hypothetical protein